MTNNSSKQLKWAVIGIASGINFIIGFGIGVALYKSTSKPSPDESPSTSQIVEPTAFNE